MTDLTLDLIIEHLGHPIRIQGNEYEWQCPICKDSGKDNLKFNKSKGILYCFANESHARRILSDIMKGNRINYTKAKKTNLKGFPAAEKAQPQELPEAVKEKLLQYMLECNTELLKDNKALKYLRNKRGLTKETVTATGLGIDKQKRRWTIPTFRYETSELIGFEYRPADLSKRGISREKGTPTGLAEINGYTPETEILVIVEGYFDGYALMQYLTEKGILRQYHIVTPSNGVQGLLKQIKAIDFEKYKQLELFIDNDETSTPIAEKIKERYPIFHKVELSCGCKDFNEHYLNCIKKK